MVEDAGRWLSSTAMTEEADPNRSDQESEVPVVIWDIWGAFWCSQPYGDSKKYSHQIVRSVNDHLPPVRR